MFIAVMAEKSCENVLLMKFDDFMEKSSHESNNIRANNYIRE